MIMRYVNTILKSSSGHNIIDLYFLHNCVITYFKFHWHKETFNTIFVDLLKNKYCLMLLVNLLLHIYDSPQLRLQNYYFFFHSAKYFLEFYEFIPLCVIIKNWLIKWDCIYLMIKVGLNDPKIIEDRNVFPLNEISLHTMFLMLLSFVIKTSFVIWCLIFILSSI